MEHTTELRHFGVKGMRWGHRKSPEVVAAKQAAKAAKVEGKLRKGASKNASYYQNAAANQKKDAAVYRAEKQVHNAYDKAGVLTKALGPQSSSAGQGGLQSRNADHARTMQKDAEGRAVKYESNAAIYAKRASGKKLNKAEVAQGQAIYKSTMKEAKAWGITSAILIGAGTVLGSNTLKVAGGITGAAAIGVAVDGRKDKKIFGV